MNLKKLRERRRFKWSRQAEMLVEELGEDFPLEAFEKWVEKEMFVVGDGWILRFLYENKNRRQNIKDEIIKSINV